MLMSSVESQCLQDEAVKGSAFPAIPWSGGKILEVMVLWIAMFFLVGGHTAFLIPQALGIDASLLSPCGHALGYFLCDVINLVLTLVLMTQALRPHNIWSMRLFSLRPTVSILPWIFAACCAFPALDALSVATQSWVLLPPDVLGHNLEQSLTSGDIAANFVYFAVVSVCTPIWEEAIFRGFLLTSLTRYLSPFAAIAASSAIFAIAHFSLHRTPYLFLLGCAIGGVFVGTRNLAAPVLVHALWNVYVFSKLSSVQAATAALALAPC
jgi:uncharacterized protein